MKNQTQNHKLYGAYLHDQAMTPTLAIGPAGTGKTFGAVAAAIDFLEDKRNRFLATRPNVAFADECGYLPGGEREKIAPWVTPIIQNFQKNGMDAEYLALMEKSGRIEFKHLAFWQGLTLDNTFILIDECENMTLSQIKGVLTRQGDNSKLVMCGDIAQTSERFKRSGLDEFIKLVQVTGCPCNVVEFTYDDILRSEQCKQWIMAFDKWDEMKGR